MNKLKLTIISLVAIGAMMVGGLVPASTVSAAVDPNRSLCEGSGGTWTGSECVNDQAEGRSVEGFIGDLVNILIFVVAAVSVLMIIIGGIKFVTSGGDQAAVKSAKNTILYAVIGLVVAFLAYALVSFLANRLDRPAGVGGSGVPVRAE